MTAPRAGRLFETHEPCRLSTVTSRPYQAVSPRSRSCEWGKFHWDAEFVADGATPATPQAAQVSRFEAGGRTLLRLDLASRLLSHAVDARCDRNATAVHQGAVLRSVCRLQRGVVAGPHRAVDHASCGQPTAVLAAAAARSLDQYPPGGALGLVRAGVPRPRSSRAPTRPHGPSRCSSSCRPRSSSGWESCSGVCCSFPRARGGRWWRGSSPRTRCCIPQ